MSWANKTDLSTDNGDLQTIEHENNSIYEQRTISPLPSAYFALTGLV
jgi:hypothetical protein